MPSHGLSSVCLERRRCLWWNWKISQLYPTLCDLMDGSLSMEFSRSEYWLAVPISRGIFPTQGLSLGLLHCRQILHHPSHQKKTRILEWVAYFLSSGSSQPRNWTGVSCIAGGFFTNWAIREARWHKVLAWLYDSKAETVNLPSSCDWFTLFFLAINTFSLKAQYPLTTHSVLEIVLH